MTLNLVYWFGVSFHWFIQTTEIWFVISLHLVHSNNWLKQIWFGVLFHWLNQTTGRNKVGLLVRCIITLVQTTSRNKFGQIGMPKERILHFISKNITITRYNSTAKASQPESQHSESKKEQSLSKTSKQGPKALLNYKQEAAYASPIIIIKSQIIQREILKEAAEFREVGKTKRNKQKKRI